MLEQMDNPAVDYERPRDSCARLESSRILKPERPWNSVVGRTALDHNVLGGHSGYDVGEVGTRIACFALS